MCETGSGMFFNSPSMIILSASVCAVAVAKQKPVRKVTRRHLDKYMLIVDLVILGISVGLCRTLAVEEMRATCPLSYWHKMALWSYSINFQPLISSAASTVLHILHPVFLPSYVEFSLRGQ